MGGLGPVARLASPHGAVELRGELPLRTLAFGELVTGAPQVLAQVETSAVKGQVTRLPLASTGIHRVVEGEVALRAIDQALGVNVEGPRQPGLARQIHTRVDQTLTRDDLPGGFRAPVTWLAPRRQHGRGLVHVHETVTEAAVAVPGALESD